MARLRSLLRDHTLLRHLAWALVAALALLAVTASLSPFRNYQLATMAAYLCATVGMALLVGLTGQLSLGHGALMATGAYTCALTSSRMSDAEVTGPLLLLVPLLAGIVAAAAVGALVGIAGARLHGPYLAGLTLALTISVPAVATTFVDVLGGDQGISTVVEPAPEALGATFPLEQWQAWICCLAALLTFVVVANLASGRFGREMRAVRDDEVAARLVGHRRPPHQGPGLRRQRSHGRPGGRSARGHHPGRLPRCLRPRAVALPRHGRRRRRARQPRRRRLGRCAARRAARPGDRGDRLARAVTRARGQARRQPRAAALRSRPRPRPDPHAARRPRGGRLGDRPALAAAPQQPRPRPPPPSPPASRAEATATTEKQKDPAASLAEDSAVHTTKSSE